MGFLCYILDSRLQTDPKGAPKPCAHLGIYVTKPWFAGESIKTADEILQPSSLPASEGADTLANKGDNNISFEEGVQSSQDDKGDGLIMPPIINLETSGLCHFPQLLEQSKMETIFTTILTRMCAFGMILATFLHPTNIFSTRHAAVNSFIH